VADVAEFIVKEVRNHLVTFRLTENEHRRLKAACGADQSSISRIVRHTVLEWVDAVGDRPGAFAQMSELSEKLGHLIKMLKEYGYSED